MKLEGKVCLVTGAAGGIGYGIAKRFVEHGARVAVADLAIARAEEAAGRLGLSGPGAAFAIAMDVTREEAVVSGVHDIASRWGRIDVLVANAGIQIVHRIEDYPFEDWKKMMAVHVDGAFLTTKSCFPVMKRQGGGAIIYMGSVHSKEASVLKSAYVTAKHGLLGLARTVAKEGAPHGIRSNVICPGFVRTVLVEKQIPEQALALGISEQDVIRNVMLGTTVDGEFTTIEDVAETAVFLAAFQTNALTGQSINVSHGWHIQ